MSTLGWIAAGLVVLVASLAFATRRRRQAAPGERRLDYRAFRNAPLDQIAGELRAGRKGEAIERMRQSTGASFEEARKAVEMLEKSLPLFEKLGLDPADAMSDPDRERD